MAMFKKSPKIFELAMLILIGVVMKEQIEKALLAIYLNYLNDVRFAGIQKDKHR